MNVLEKLKPGGVFRFFEAISGIPRGSGNEKGIGDYLVGFAERRGLYVFRDDSLNVIIKKPGSYGYEDSPPVLLQGHVDMVCEKNAGTAHDFENDPLKLIIDGDFIRADGTTLGADNGIAVAYILALLDSDDIPHPPIEAALTTNEEIGLEGAAAIEADKLSAKRMINFDCGREGVFTVSCAGGLMTSVTFDAKKTGAPEGYEFLQIDISGLSGGHSGADIHLGKANANVLLGRLLYALDKKYDVRLADIGGGMKDNAIPRESFAVVAARPGDIEKITEEAARFNKIFIDEYLTTDPGLKLTVKRAATGAVYAKNILGDVAAVILTIPNGALAMDANIPGLVETSNNLGVIRAAETGIVLTNALRSSVLSRKELTEARVVAAAEGRGATAVSSNDYPAWPYRPDSELRKLFIETYRDMYGAEPVAEGIHAGLECGVFGGKINGLDAIACGPDMFDVHTPDERLSVSSTARVWEFLIEILRRLK